MDGFSHLFEEIARGSGGPTCDHGEYPWIYSPETDNKTLCQDDFPCDHPATYIAGGKMLCEYHKRVKEVYGHA